FRVGRRGGRRAWVRAPGRQARLVTLGRPAAPGRAGGRAGDVTQAAHARRTHRGLVAGGGREPGRAAARPARRGGSVDPAHRAQRAARAGPVRSRLRAQRRPPPRRGTAGSPRPQPRSAERLPRRGGVTSAEPLLLLQGVEAGFGANLVLHGVDLTVHEGTSVGLFGLNGAGKSVTMKVIAGLVPAREGSVSLRGQDVTALSPEDRVALGMAYTPQARQLFPRLTVEQNLRLGGYVLRPRDTPRFAALVAW